MVYFWGCHAKNKHAINKWYTIHTGANMVETTYYILIWERARKRKRKSEREQFIYIFTRLAITMVSTDGLEALVPSVNCNPLGGWPVVTSEQWPVHDTRQCRCIKCTRVFGQYGWIHDVIDKIYYSCIVNIIHTKQHDVLVIDTIQYDWSWCNRHNTNRL